MNKEQFKKAAGEVGRAAVGGAVLGAIIGTFAFTFRVIANSVKDA